MKKYILFSLVFILSLGLAFASESTTGNVSLSVAIDSVAIGFVNTVEEAKSATASTTNTSHSVA